MIHTTLSFVWAWLPLGAWIANLCTGKRIHPALLYVITGVTGYLLLLASVWALDVQLAAEMNSFDLDGDGSFRRDELTPEAKRAMDKYTSDTGRTFAPIFGIPITAIWYAVLFSVAFGGEWVFRFLTRQKEGDSPEAKPSRDGNCEPTKSDNPYQSPSVR